MPWLYHHVSHNRSSWLLWRWSCVAVAVVVVIVMMMMMNVITARAMMMMMMIIVMMMTMMIIAMMMVMIIVMVIMIMITEMELQGQRSCLHPIQELFLWSLHARQVDMAVIFWERCQVREHPTARWLMLWWACVERKGLRGCKRIVISAGRVINVRAVRLWGLCWK